MMAGGSIYDGIVEGLELNGSMVPRERDRLILLALNDIGRNVEKIKTLEERVIKLEAANLIMLAKKYPKVTVGILTFFGVLTIAVILHLGMAEWVLRLLGIPVP